MAAPSISAPRVTVFVDGRRDPAALDDALASVCAQSETALQIVLLASDDALRTLHSSDPRVATVSALQDTLLDVARAPWVKVVPATSVLRPHCIERELAAVHASANASAVFARAESVDADGRPVVDELAALATSFARGGDALRLSLLERSALAPASVLFARDSARDAGGLDPALDEHALHDLCLRLALRARPVVVDETLCRVRAHDVRDVAEPARTRPARVDARFRALVELRRRGWRWDESRASDVAPAELLDLARAVQRSGLIELSSFARELIAAARARGDLATLDTTGLEAVLGAAPELTRVPAWRDRAGARDVVEGATSAALRAPARSLCTRLDELSDELALVLRGRERVEGRVADLARDAAMARVAAERTRGVVTEVVEKLRLGKRLRAGAESLLERVMPTTRSSPDAPPQSDASAHASMKGRDDAAEAPSPDVDQRHALALRDILTAQHDARGFVLFAPTLRWQHELFQRPHQLAIELARRGYLVFFLEGVWPAPGEGGFTRIDDRLYTATARLETFSVLDAPLVFFLSYNALDLSCLRRPRTIYELIDELEVFRGDTAAIRRTHEQLLENADVVVATARRLYAHVRTRRRDAILCPNAVDYEHFRRAAEPGPIPSDLTALLRPGHPVIGYYGALASWVDYELIRFAALRRPDLEFVLIGPDYDGSLAHTDVLALPNVHRLDSRPYADLPGYLRGFDVATIPFVVNDVTESTSPIKLFEYMAARKPVVTTAMSECRRYDGVWIAEDGEQFAALLDRALASRGDVAHLARLDAVARANTWHARVEQILDAVEARLGARDAPTRTPDVARTAAR